MSAVHHPTRCVRTLRGHTGAIFAARFNADGAYCLTCGADRTLRLWNPHRDGAEGRGSALMVKEYAGPHAHEVRDVVVSRDNARFASCGGDKAAFLWDVSSARVLRRFGGHQGMLNAVALNAEDSVLLTASYDRHVRLWDVRTSSREPIQVLPPFGDSVTSVVAAAHEVVAGSVDGCLRAFDLRRALVLTDQLHDPITCVSLSRDGQCVLAGCMNGTLSLLEKRDGSRLNVYRGHAHAQYAIGSCLTRDDAHVVSGSEDGAVLVWDLVEATVRTTLRGHKATVCTVAPHPKEANVLLSASHDGTAKLWC